MLRCRSATGRLIAAILAIAGFAQHPAIAAGGMVIRVLADGAAASSARGHDVVDVWSIADAFALARKERARTPGEIPIVIEITGGTHRLTEPIRLGPSDSGTPGHPLIIRGAPDGGTRIVASVPLIDAGNPEPELLLRVPPAARDHVRLYRLPGTVARMLRSDVTRRHADLIAPPVPFEIFDRSGALLPARWPNEGWANVISAADNAESATFTADAERLSRWRAETDLWAAGYWKWNWSFETRPVAAVDPLGGSVTLAEPTHYGIVPGARYIIYHALSELDRPGEWARTPDRRAVVIWPRTNGRGVEASVGESLFILDNTRHIRFESLLFGRTRGDAIVINGGAGVVVADSTIEFTGGRGVVLNDAQRSGVENCSITETGAGGVELSSGDRPSLTPAGLFVSRSSIAHAGRLGRTYRPAIRIAGVGNAAIGNLIADLPHSAIIFAGNDHRIELNEITRAVTETSDAGAIYTGRDWSARGTMVRNNFLHDIRGTNGFETKGVYLDDMASGISVDENLFLRVDQPVFIGGGRDNEITGNLMIASDPAIHMDSRGTGWSRQSVEEADSELRRNLEAVPYKTAAWRERYPALSTILDRRPGLPLGNRSRGNVLVGEDLYDLEGDARDQASGLGPDVAVSAGEVGAASAMSDASSAAEIGGLIAEAPGTVRWPALPFARMDRQVLHATVPRAVN